MLTNLVDAILLHQRLLKGAHGLRAPIPRGSMACMRATERRRGVRACCARRDTAASVSLLTIPIYF